MITIRRIDYDRADEILEVVLRLLTEISDAPEERTLGDINKIKRDWQTSADRFTVLVAEDDAAGPVGMMTLAESFAIFAGGVYGIINELYISPEHRSIGVGKKLIDASKNIARERGWLRIDVTAPGGEKWERTVNFYKREGFVPTGPKLKFMVGK